MYQYSFIPSTYNYPLQGQLNFPLYDQRSLYNASSTQFYPQQNLQTIFQQAYCGANYASSYGAGYSPQQIIMANSYIPQQPVISSIDYNTLQANFDAQQGYVFLNTSAFEKKSAPSQLKDFNQCETHQQLKQQDAQTTTLKENEKEKELPQEQEKPGQQYQIYQIATNYRRTKKRSSLENEKITERNAMKNISSQLLCFLQNRETKKLVFALLDEDTNNTKYSKQQIYNKLIRFLNKKEKFIFTVENLTAKFWESKSSDPESRVLLNKVIRKLCYFFLRKHLVLKILTSKQIKNQKVHLDLRRRLMHAIQDCFEDY